ncbi:hypothetical protein NQ036_03845 [Brevibacterium sp. 91QC2O2]|uniref:hypothetical protein n=1 Tax=Brevibacterium TaxID=1696 RepID=UPI00211C5C32|nr:MULTISPECIES: hypothetical protein [unclassified Brevibacterium]MCQ9367380.1 hypothetical protein [Brevibacterium sp. 91QC2O2]MCQ9384607.1 hypothetical protein [Brevibacterium sp. 68QC2CO]
MSGLAMLTIENVTIQMNVRVHNDLDFVIRENLGFNDGVLVVGPDENGVEQRLWVGPHVDYDLQVIHLDPSAPPRVPEADRMMYEDELYDTRRAGRTAVAYVGGEELILESE